MTNLLFELLTGGLRGNVRTSSVARWKARGRLPIRDYWTFLASSYGCDVITRYWSNRRFSEGMGHFVRKCDVEGDVAPNHCWYQKTTVFLLPHSEDRVILFSFVWIGYQRVSDRETGRQTELPWLIQRCALQAMRPRCKNRRRDVRRGFGCRVALPRGARVGTVSVL